MRCEGLSASAELLITIVEDSLVASFSLSCSRLRNDLYCVEWDVKLYYTIPFIIMHQHVVICTAWYCYGISLCLYICLLVQCHFVSK